MPRLIISLFAAAFVAAFLFAAPSLAALCGPGEPTVAEAAAKIAAKWPGAMAIELDAAAMTNMRRWLDHNGIDWPAERMIAYHGVAPDAVLVSLIVGDCVIGGGP